jgi:hypothetical protein
MCQRFVDIGLDSSGVVNRVCCRKSEMTRFACHEEKTKSKKPCRLLGDRANLYLAQLHHVFCISK